MNNQKIEKPISSSGEVLDVHSIFLTIQGEGIFSGQPAVFIRLAGCNLACPQCDTDYTLGRLEMDIKGLVSQVMSIKQGTELVVITGGEPFRQNITKLCNLLIGCGMMVQVETNGTLPVPEDVSTQVTIVVSPKTSSVHTSVIKRAACVKYVMNSEEVGADGLPNQVLGNSYKKVVRRIPIRTYLQPEDSGCTSKNRSNLDTCVESCLSNGYTLQVQIHKVVGIS